MIASTLARAAPASVACALACFGVAEAAPQGRACETAAAWSCETSGAARGTSPSPALAGADGREARTAPLQPNSGTPWASTAGDAKQVPGEAGTAAPERGERLAETRDHRAPNVRDHRSPNVRDHRTPERQNRTVPTRRAEICTITGTLLGPRVVRYREGGSGPTRVSRAEHVILLSRRTGMPVDTATLLPDGPSAARYSFEGVPMDDSYVLAIEGAGWFIGQRGQPFETRCIRAGARHHVSDQRIGFRSGGS
jgi:hypothetical protein